MHNDEKSPRPFGEGLGIGSILTAQEAATLRSLIDGAQRVVVTCHIGPDGDAMGSVLALTHWLTRLGKTVQPIVPNAYPDFFKWMPGVEKVLVAEFRGDKVKPHLAEADLVFYLDFNDEKRMYRLESLMRHCTAPRVMIDHHINPVIANLSVKISRPEMSSTCELLLRIMMQLGAYDDMTVEEATCLYTGLMTDTGAFTYSSNRPEVFACVSALIEKGIDKDKIYRNVFHSWSVQRFALLGYLLHEKWEYIDECRTSIISLTRDELEEYGYRKGDTEGVVNMPLQIQGTRLSVFLREDTERPVIKVSLRSVDDFDCREMAAECFNGGGHFNASGGELEMEMEQALKWTRKAVMKYKDRLTPPQPSPQGEGG